MKILLVRHGETEENKQGILQGWLPGILSSRGKRQAIIIAKRLRSIPIDYIYTSDLKRSVDTAKEIAKYHPQARFVKEQFLRERRLGEFQGRKIGQADWEALPGTMLTNKPQGGEGWKEVWIRVRKFYCKIIQKPVHDTVLVVGHGGSLCLLEGMIRHKNFREAMKQKKLKPAAVVIYRSNKRDYFQHESIDYN